MGKVKRKGDEIKRFIAFLERTRRDDEIEKYKWTTKCIDVHDHFSATATRKEEKRKAHLKRVDTHYKPFREHALNCRRCRITLDGIFAFTGHENRAIFTGKETLAILDREWEHSPEKGLYLCKIPQPGFSHEELTYITGLPLIKALKEFEDKIRIPLGLSPFEAPVIRKKTTYRGKGIPYSQATLFSKDNRYKTKIGIRSRTVN
jgi:hypothetical protein